MENFVFCAVFYSKCAISVTVYAYLFPALLFLKSTWHVMCHALLEKQIKEQFLQKLFLVYPTKLVRSWSDARKLQQMINRSLKDFWHSVQKQPPKAKTEKN